MTCVGLCEVLQVSAGVSFHAEIAFLDLTDMLTNSSLEGNLLCAMLVVSPSSSCPHAHPHSHPGVPNTSALEAPGFHF